ncbi:Aste57867_21743 [Aphanomyces stellatus]|uniref:Aste57867_21743 protein n=1 Tax=Aphanomyces stellatus TaxID=120398 RepID=A0A485LJJ8_9STRA|nr:hypothetical protein As57867_021674 [Aphanomyces stellatus]VFT98412.1 Aste57867_21743 [Aphanomyces stellatus]
MPSMATMTLDSPPRSFVDELADIVSEPSKPLLELAQAKLGIGAASNQKAAVFPRRSVLPAGFWARVATDGATPQPKTKAVDVIAPASAEDAFAKRSRFSSVDVAPEAASDTTTGTLQHGSRHNAHQGVGVESSGVGSEIYNHDFYDEETIVRDEEDETTTAVAEYDDAAIVQEEEEDAFAQFVDMSAIRNDMEVKRLTKQNEFLVLMLRKVTAKVMQNRADIAAHKARITVLQMPPPATPTAEIACQTDDEEVVVPDTQKIEALTWQLKVASAKIASLAQCVQVERERVEAQAAAAATRVATAEHNADLWKTRLAACHEEIDAQQVTIARHEEMQTVMRTYFGATGIDLDGAMDVAAVKAALALKPVKQTHLTHADSIYDRVTASMARELAFLAKLDQLDPTNTDSCDELCKSKLARRKRQ